MILICLTLTLLSTAVQSFSQGPVITSSDQLTYSFEDVSDFLRKYPGMYPMDYGVFGAPVVFRPWNLAAWQMEVRKDGIPMSRVYDGLYDPNLDPPSELATIRYDFLRGAGGEFQFRTRDLPVDTPYTELRIREGYYGFGTVDFAHGQRFRNDLTLEVTGRLGWYDGFRHNVSSSRFNRLRGRVKFKLGKQWGAGVTYEGSHVDAQSAIQPAGSYYEREQGILTIARSDTNGRQRSPVFRFFLRQDREQWGTRFRAREATGGWVMDAELPLPIRKLRLRNTVISSRIDAPGLEAHDEIYFEIEERDTIEMNFASAMLHGGIRRESALHLNDDEQWKPLLRAGADVRSADVGGLYVHAAAAYSESVAPILWTRGNYTIGDRPLLVDPAFGDTLFTGLENHFSGAMVRGTRGVDRFLNSRIGIGYRKNGTALDVSLMAIDRMGDFGNHFVKNDTSVHLAYDKSIDHESKYGISTFVVLPLRYGVRLDSRWFSQSSSTDPGLSVEARSYSRLYFEREFFTSPLTVRAHLSHEYLGSREAVSELGSEVLDNEHVFGFRLSGTIQGVTLIWGVENLLDNVYYYLPGYRMIHKEEYFKVIWKLWL